MKQFTIRDIVVNNLKRRQLVKMFFFFWRKWLTFLRWMDASEISEFIRSLPVSASTICGNKLLKDFVYFSDSEWFILQNLLLLMFCECRASQSMQPFYLWRLQ